MFLAKLRHNQNVAKMTYTATAPIGKSLLMQLRELFHKDSMRWGCMFDIFMFSGARALECLQLKVSHVAIPVEDIEMTWVDGDCALYEVKKGIGHRYEAREDILIYTTKQDRGNRRSTRSVAMGPIPKKSIEAYLNSFERPIGPDDWLFPGQETHLQYQTALDKLRLNCKKLKITEAVIGGRIGFHMIRKAFSLALYQTLGSTYEAAMKVRRELGHTNVETTYRYIGIKIDEGASEVIRTGSIYDVKLVDRIIGKESALISWSTLYDIFESSGALDIQLASWLRTYSQDEGDIQRTIEWMKSKKQKIEYLW